MRTNCVNCGAAIDTDINKCPFCGTSYYDLTAIDFDSKDPVACSFRMPHSNGKLIMTMLAVPSLEDVSMETQTADILSPMGYKLAVYDISRSMNIGVKFSPVTKPDNTLFHLSLEE